MALGPNGGSISDADYHHETLDNLQIAVCSFLLFGSLDLIFFHVPVRVLFGFFGLCLILWDLICMLSTILRKLLLLKMMDLRL